MMELRVLLRGSGFPKLRSTVTLLRSAGEVALVDTGLIDDAGLLLAALAEAGVEPGEVTRIITTHLHYDHCGNHLLFPRARYLVSAVELAETRSFLACFAADSTPGKGATADVLRRRNETIKPFYIRSIVREVTRNWDFYERVLEGNDSFVAVGRQRWIGEEIELLPTPGHTPGHLSVVAHGVRLAGSSEPEVVLVAGDAVFAAEPSGGGADGLEVHMASDVALYRRNCEALMGRFRYIVPGHGDLVDLAARSTARRIAV